MPYGVTSYTRIIFSRLTPAENNGPQRRRIIGLRVAGSAANLAGMSTVQEIEKAIEQLPWPERLKVYRDLPDLIGRQPEDLDWQRAGLEKFFADDSPDDSVYDQL